MKSSVLVSLILGVLVLLYSSCFAQTALEPDQIDPYTFDPALLVQPADYASQASSAYSNGEYEKAARYYLVHLQTSQDDAVSWYNLSCCFGLLGKPDLAAKYLQMAYKAGYTDLKHIKADTDFAQVSQTASFQTALDSLQTWSERRVYLEGETRYLPTRNLLPYYLHLPRDFDPSKSYTLLIGLHGYGDVARRFSRLWRLLENDEIIFVVPETPNPFTEGEIGFSWSPEVPYASPVADQAYKLLTQYITDLQLELCADYKVSKTWLMGFSQGAYFGYMLALKNPWLFEGLIACGGGLVTEVFSEIDYAAAKDLKIIISHGKQDKVVGFEEAVNASKILEEKGFKGVYFEEFEGGHQIPPKVFDQFRKWLTQ